MENKKNTQLVIIGVLAVAILFMSVGFAAYARELTINGTARVGAYKWSVHFVENSYTESTGSVAATSHTLGETAMTYDVTLNTPGDFYEFTVNVINDGNFNAQLSSITLSPLDAAQSKYLTYTLTYENVDYTASATGLTYSLPYTGTNTKPVKVRVAYVLPENSADLPTEAVNVSLTATLNYTQVA